MLATAESATVTCLRVSHLVPLLLLITLFLSPRALLHQYTKVSINLALFKLAQITQSSDLDYVFLLRYQSISRTLILLFKTWIHGLWNGSFWSVNRFQWWVLLSNAHKVTFSYIIIEPLSPLMSSYAYLHLQQLLFTTFQLNQPNEDFLSPQLQDLLWLSRYKVCQCFNNAMGVVLHECLLSSKEKANGKD